ncbi:MAG: hypothetical protein KGZ37_02250 [Nitrosarchaeum sp.]|nr:hypothetical protein [Nitrosarchaeum sp.]
MKTRLLILAGIVLFLFGISTVAYVIFGDSEIKMNVEEILLFIFGLMVPGMILSGIGVSLEFSKKKWG